ncbi:hypothetical protein COMNV_01567 [Commensalibacter sp. Nvir]|uniref:hypothetical protein n=1 Tax=Commensalibacter sp. Nvir TaxID=3069817 RepID=UPI002D316DFB|nr:hypothetical protein COMNV_01567 [Commensalibacter sp. Nvir]
MNQYKLSLYSLCALAPFLFVHVCAQNVVDNSNNSTTLSSGFQNPSTQFQPTQPAQGNGESITVRGHRTPPPGYTYAPSMNLNKGPDPDHQRGLSESKDPVSGANLSRYGTAYRESGPLGSGQVGDSTGNSWLTPR